MPLFHPLACSLQHYTTINYRNNLGMPLNKEKTLLCFFSIPTRRMVQNLKAYTNKPFFNSCIWGIHALSLSLIIQHIQTLSMFILRHLVEKKHYYFYTKGKQKQSLDQITLQQKNYENKEASGTKKKRESGRERGEGRGQRDIQRNRERGKGQREREREREHCV